MVDVAFRKLLVEAPGVTEMASGRIYPSQAPDNVTLPAVVYQQISDVPRYVNGNDSCFRQMRYQTDSYATTLAAARQLDEGIRARLSGYSGSVHGHRLTVFRGNGYPATYEAEGYWRVTSDFTVIASS